MITSGHIWPWSVLVPVASASVILKVTFSCVSTLLSLHTTVIENKAVINRVIYLYFALFRLLPPADNSENSYKMDAVECR